MALALDGKVQSTNFFGTSQSASLTTTGGSGVIVVSLCHSNGSTASVPTATGLTFTQRGSTVVGSGGNNYNISHFTAPYTTNFSGSITCTISGGGGTVDIVAFGISGAATTSFFDSSGGLPAGAATGNVSASTSNANDFVFCTYSTTSSDSSSTAPWISLFASSENFHHVMYQIVSATGTQSPTLATGGPAVGGVLDAIIQASGGAPSGTLATTEAQDAAAFAGTFADQGTLATTEATDTAAFAGSFADTGTLATTEATDTAAFAGSFADQGSFAVTEATDAAAFNGNVGTSGTFAITEGTDTAAFTGGNVVSGTLATTEAIDTAAFAGGFSDQGSFALTEAADVTAFAGTFDDEGILAVTDAPDIAAFAGGDSGTLAATEAPDIGTFTGDVPSGIDTHDGGSYDYHRYWKGLKDKEDEKRRKRLEAEAEAEAVVEIIEEVAEEVAKAKPENPVKPDYSRVVENLKEIAVEQTEGRRRLDEERILQLIEDDERELINMVMKLALETAE